MLRYTRSYYFVVVMIFILTSKPEKKTQVSIKILWKGKTHQPRLKDIQEPSVRASILQLPLPCEIRAWGGQVKERNQYFISTITSIYQSI